MATATHPHTDVNASSLAGARARFAYTGLSRPRAGRILAGVTASFARAYDINPLVARLLGITIAIVLTPLVYVAAWILMPNDAADAADAPTAAPAA
jgi:phage shock protein PspC (stress-responsive transcriptional regulator)